MSVLETQVCVIGGGSGGIGAAVGAAAKGASVLLVEKNHQLGGTVTGAWVHDWEPTAGCSPLCERIWNRMRAIPGGAEDVDYHVADSRLGPDGKRNPGLAFEPWAYLAAVDAELSSVGATNVLYNSPFASCRTDGRRLSGITALTPSGPVEIRAKVFIDATADIHVARQAGCRTAIGAEPRAEYDEPHAPDRPEPKLLNKVNWLYRVREGDRPVETDDAPLPPEAEVPRRHEVRLPNGDILVNVCGKIAADPSEPDGFAEAMRQAWKLSWDIHRWSVREGGRANREMIAMAPELGVRETWRLVGRYVLDENDVLAGREGSGRDDAIAASDHALDAHGQLGMELPNGAYGVPFGCLQPVELDNLLVACRGASFSHLAASSCRLSRTMMTLGEAAGAAAALAVDRCVDPADVPAGDILDRE